MNIILKFIHLHQNPSISFSVRDSEEILASVCQEIDRQTDRQIDIRICIRVLFVTIESESKPPPINKTISTKCQMLISQNPKWNSKRWNHSCICQCGGISEKMMNYELEKITCNITLIEGSKTHKNYLWIHMYIVKQFF